MRAKSAWFSVLAVAVSIYLFLKGFFLSRMEVLLISEPTLPAEWDSNSPPWFPRLYDRVVLIIVDALRTDMVTGRDTSTDQPCDPSSHYCGRLRSIPTLHTSHPAASRLYKFRADPPTSTMLRLKGLTTGSLPTFFEIGKSFSADSIQEDSLIRQLRDSGRAACVVGDDTWQQLFPAEGGFWAASHPYPSLDVRDLHGVDRGVRLLLPRLIANASLRHSGLVIGHLLGVDHVGHLHRVDHPEMALKLAEVDELIEATVRQVERDRGARTLLMVMGDHGQTMTGDHGGGSAEETDSVLWAFDPVLASRSDPAPPPSALPALPLMSQLDFTASLMALLGLPIPFSNIGKVNADLLTLGAGLTPPPPSRALLVNARQVMRYLDTYVQQGGSLDSARLRPLRVRITELEALCSDEASASEACVRGATAFLEAAADLGRKQFTQFDDWSMGAAMLLLLASVLLPALRALPAPLSRPLTLLARLLRHHFTEVLVTGALIFKSASLTGVIFVLEEPLLDAGLIAALVLVWAASSLRRTRSASSLALPLTFLVLVALIVNVGRVEEPSPSNPFDHRRVGFVAKKRLEVLLREQLPLALQPHFSGLLRSLACSLTGVFSLLFSSPTSFVNPDFSSFFSLVAHSLAGSIHHVQIMVDFYPNSVFLKSLLILIPRASTLAACLSIGLSSASDRPLTFQFITVLLSLVARDQGVFVLTLALLSLITFKHALKRPSSPLPPYLGSFLLVLFADLCFFAQGHRCEFAGLQYTSAYVGLSEYHSLISALLLALNTFAMHILVSFSASKFGLCNFVLQSRSVLLLGAYLCGSVHRRHLMIWGLFAPRLLFECCFAAVSLPFHI